MAQIVTTEKITETLNGRSVLLSDKLSSDYTTMTEDQILNGTGVAAMVSDLKNNRACGGLAKVTGGGGAVGYKASAVNGGAVGQQASTSNGGAVGLQTYTGSGGAVGQYAKSDAGAAMGWNSSTSNGAALGWYAVCASGNTRIDAIQLGRGTNSTVKSMQVYGTTLMTPVDASVDSPTMLIPLSLITASYHAADPLDQAAFKQELGIS